MAIPTTFLSASTTNLSISHLVGAHAVAGKSFPAEAARHMLKRPASAGVVEMSPRCGRLSESACPRAGEAFGAAAGVHHGMLYEILRRHVLNVGRSMGK